MTSPIGSPARDTENLNRPRPEILPRAVRHGSRLYRHMGDVGLSLTDNIQGVLTVVGNGKPKSLISRAKKVKPASFNIYDDKKEQSKIKKIYRDIIKSNTVSQNHINSLVKLGGVKILIQKVSRDIDSSEAVEPIQAKILRALNAEKPIIQKIQNTITQSRKIALQQAKYLYLLGGLEALPLSNTVRTCFINNTNAENLSTWISELVKKYPNVITVFLKNTNFREIHIQQLKNFRELETIYIGKTEEQIRTMIQDWSEGSIRFLNEKLGDSPIQGPIQKIRPNRNACTQCVIS